MASGAYSFIDIAVLDAVRTRFAAGDALVVLSVDLETVLWANGAGALLFGYPDIEAVMDASSGLSPAARRQIAATPGFPGIGRDRSLLVRLASRIVAFQASGIRLPDGERAVLLAEPAGVATHDSEETSARAITGFSEAGYFAALVDEHGDIAAATGGFSSLGIDRDALLALAGEVRGDQDRLVKRLVRAGSALYPAGFARLTDDPQRYLLVVVDEDQSEIARSEQSTAHEETPFGVEQDNRNPAGRPRPVAHEAGGAPKIRDVQIDHWYFGRDEAREESAPVSAAPPEEVEPVPVRIEARPAGQSKPARREAAEQSAPQRPAGPVRFVWRTDAEGRFSAISDDFAKAVGASAADVIGRRFRDVANAFGLDPEGEIAGLLERRDTWSGRSVHWPIAGTDLKAPVDLAALPVYARDRSFEGFRGFGVVRVGDAAPDPEALGLALVQGRPEADEPVTPPARDKSSSAAPRPGGADPFRGEVPALVIDNTPERRFTDKVIRLAEHRQPAVERSLTPVERSAFREIGDRLKKDGAGRVRPVEPGTRPIGEEAAPTSQTAAVEREEAEAAIADEARIQAAEISPEAETAERSVVERSAEQESVEATGTGSESGTTPEPMITEAAADQDAVEPETPTDLPPPAAAAPPLQAEGFLPAAFPDEAFPRRPQIDVSILSRLPVPVLIHSGDFLHYANDEFFDLTGYDTLDALAAAGGLDALFADPYEADDGNGATGRKLRLRAADGEEFPVEALLQSVPWSGGKALLLAIRPAIANVADETPGTELPAPGADFEARLAELHTILDTATDGVVLITNEGAIRSISRPAEALFGFDSSEVSGEPFTSLFAVESQRAARDYLTSLSDNGVASVLNDGREVIGREAQGRFIPLFMTIGKMPGDSGYCAVLRDITHWKRAEEELTQARAQAERSSSQKTDFLARVSHEIRTPLNAIIGFSELMIDEKFGPVGNDRYRDYLRDINRSGNHVLDLVNDLLDISKIEAGEQEMSYEAVSLNDTLAESVAMLQPQANRERVIIRSSFASKLPEVVADLRSIRQIAINLLSNAIRYTPAGGQVIVSTAYETSGDIVMRVRDTGVGMTHAEIEQALKPFKQVSALRRGRGDGTGLGLPLTKAMVEANRARFSINSTPGEGTMVEITFPSTRVLAD